ncbi:MAG: methylated-DNA--[protein]-cysteine S-methyltransferase [Clostridiales bacterium]|nr:methylated-DNA--[protein]-cysteine S-methyltransferase [Clostridiales bacterium]MDY6117336.1 methylated-DNA--[protein]-cysteine S-methyltransferase [Anaerovoracaceae bacterium]
MLYINHYQSPLGGMTMSSNGEALTGLWFDSSQQNRSSLKGVKREKTNNSSKVFDEAEEWLNIYFTGRAPDFMPNISLDGTEFQKAVWDILLSIPYGEIMTYGEIADQIAKERGIKRMSAQAVGGAVSHNPISLIVPCHRVVGRNGKLTGYAGGIDKKLRLLRLEGVDTSKMV